MTAQLPQDDDPVTSSPDDESSSQTPTGAAPTANGTPSAPPAASSSGAGDGGRAHGDVRDVLDDVAAARDDLGAFIRKQREQAKLSLRNLSKIAGVSNPYLSQIERGLRNPSAEILQAIAKALDLSAETLYVRAGILDERTDSDVESSIARDSYLTENQRATLIEMYRTFRSMGGPGVPAAPTSNEPGDGGVVGRVLDRVTTGEVTDADVAATTVEGEDPTEA